MVLGNYSFFFLPFKGTKTIPLIWGMSYQTSSIGSKILHFQHFSQNLGNLNKKISKKQIDNGWECFEVDMNLAVLNYLFSVQ